MALDVKKIVAEFRSGRTSPYDEAKHCEMLVNIMTNPDECRISAFCVKALIHEDTFWKWTHKHEVFGNLYSFCKMLARELWEEEGLRISNMVIPIGTQSYAFEHWKLIGWSRFGISKNSRIKLHLNPEDSADKHYSQLLKQASEGDFTAAEIKQLMEAVNVGLNTHQVFALQKEIDQLKSDLATMKENTDAHNSSTNKGIAQKD